ncbi:MAG: bifunctional (p)ppGpp synthetase/guanosine-3',5'-bis(diphosphate) 3'-pyrophosphohydrolase [Candidatus Glassbacteria bacterium]|nr:bifunctional (p)ppGpp synthetase/guanosine-3',5'-bis(diphosphate) 3'-pyrophosphohydrolase [Candidatus Glassbacteria bacterium]
MPKQSLFEILEGINSLDMGPIELAYEFGARAHAGQKRKSGDDFIWHAVEVVRILVDLNLYDSISIASALIHDVIEDTDCPLEDIRCEFGDEIAGIVDGLTKISRMDGYVYRSAQEEQVDNYRKLILSMAKDIRVILIKFADRLHNMRTLYALSDEKKRRIARETLDIYAPLAHRFGIALIRWELEDLSFKYLEPAKYKKLAKQVQTKRGEREKLIDQFKDPLQKAINEAGIEAEVSGRPKHLYSIYKKMERRGNSFEDIYDLLGLRVMTRSVAECYHILGLVHSTWTPLHDRFKDYIATPKSNMYQSLHTTVYGNQGQMIEVQIRTFDMHRTAEYGIAAHWKFKENLKGESDIDRRMTWLREVLEWQSEATDPREFMEFLKVDLFHDEVFVFTPRGKLIKLPTGATLVDFAFAVHTEVGLQCSGGKIDGKIAPLHTRLKSGQTVEIITNANTKPSKDWLKFVRTSKARSKVRSWVREQEYTDSVRLGKDMLVREFKRQRKSRVDEQQLAGAAEKLNVSPSSEKLYEALGQGIVSLRQVMHTLFPEDAQKETRPAEVSTMDRLMDKIRKGGRDSGIKLQGIGNLMVTCAGCCQPVPGDKVEGYITRGRGITIHRTDCPNLIRTGSNSDRRVPIEWESDKGDQFIVRLLVSGTDRKGVLAEMTSAITDSGTNIRGASTKSAEFDFTATFVVEVSNLKQLDKVITALKKIKGIDRVQRKESFSSEALSSPG